jgi:YHS domain-containing protein
MRNFALAAVAALVLGLAGTTLVFGEGHPTKAPENVTNTYCPVMGKDSFVDPKIRMEYEGQYVYFCCDGCLQMFKKDPAKYLASMPQEDLEAIKVNDTCPASGEKIEGRDIRGEYKGKLVYFCCAGCKSSYDKKQATN